MSLGASDHEATRTHYTICQLGPKRCRLCLRIARRKLQFNEDSIKARFST